MTSGVNQFAVALRSLALAIWFGGGIATALATSAVFHHSESRKLAGDLAGAILRRTNAMRGVAAVSFALAALLGAATWLAAACLILQIVAVPVDRAARRLRRQLGGSIETAGVDDPLRRRFGALHGIAMLLLLLQVVLSALALALQ